MRRNRGGGIGIALSLVAALGSAQPPQSARIAFVSTRDGAPQVYTMDVDGQRVERITYERGGAFEPAWSPDGSLLAYRATGGIYLIGLNGWKERLVEADAKGSLPAWSPDGRWLSFHTELFSTNGGIDLIDRNGTARRRIVDVGETHTSWSPDGLSLLYADRGDLMRMALSTSESVTLSHTPTLGEGGARWSPDNSRIVYHMATDDGAFLYIMTPDGERIERITDAREGWEPAWSTDGRQVVFVSHNDLYAIQTDGSYLRSLTDHPA
ncbi:MAG: hypothetical protein O3A46_14770, partial [Candidatus Poribacteria bacterium]|nr:hypothetical protein [Candidatus Poribacteria bacterium]